MDVSAMLITYVIWLGFGYLMGSVPYGLLFTKSAGLGDVRNIGSGNIGATNVLRTGRKGLALATLLADALKGTVAILIAHLWGPDQAILAGIGAFLGHLFPVWLRFKGGKGVATFIGVALGLHWPSAIVFCLIWIGTAYSFRYSSLAALAATAVTPVAAWWGFGEHRMAVVFGILGVLVFVRHRANIARLLSGTESKIGAKKD